MFRKATIEDFKAIYTIYMTPEVNYFMSFEIMSEEDFKPLFEEFMTEKETFVYVDNYEVVAVLNVTRYPRRMQYTALIGGVGVLPIHHHKGYGQKLMQGVIEYLKAKEFKRIELGVEIRNAKAIAFYVKLGFEIEGRLRQSFKRAFEQEFDEHYLMSLILP